MMTIKKHLKFWVCNKKNVFKQHFFTRDAGYSKIKSNEQTGAIWNKNYKYLNLNIVINHKSSPLTVSDYIIY